MARQGDVGSSELAGRIGVGHTRPVRSGEKSQTQQTVQQPEAGNESTATGPDLRTASVQFKRALLAAARRPRGRLAMTGTILALLTTVTGVGGATIVPALGAEEHAPAPVTRPLETPPAEPAQPTSPPLTGSPSPSPSPRPAEQFAAWATTISGKVDIPVVALQAYGYAEWVLSQTRPSCKLQWTTLAAIGKVESDHGRVHGAKLDADARALPPIIGPALDGTKGNQAVADTDGGALDDDKKWDHAVGPMQFIPRTWLAYAVDADGDQVADPHDLDDAALASAYYLCASGKDLSVVADWKAVVLTYNNVGVYLEKIFKTAEAYGVKSRT